MTPHRLRGRAAVVLVAVVAVAALAAGCGIPRDAAPRRIDDSRVPFGLLRTATPEAAPTPPPAAAEHVYLVRNDRLVPVPARGGLDALIRQLLRSPGPQETSAGLTTELSPDTRLRSTLVSDGTAILTLDGPVVEFRGAEQVLAAGQIVLTACSVPGIRSVGLRIGNEALQLPLADGTLANRPVTATDYASLLERPTSPPAAPLAPGAPATPATPAARS